IRFEPLWNWLPTPMLRAASGLAGRLDQRGAVGRRANRLLKDSAAAPADRLTGYFRWAPESELRSLYGTDVRDALAGARADDPLQLFLRGIPAGPTRMERALALEQRFFLPDHNLTYTDKM